MTRISDAVRSLNSGDSAAFTSAIKDELMDRVNGSIELRKIEVAQGLFGDIEEAEALDALTSAGSEQAAVLTKKNVELTSPTKVDKDGMRRGLKASTDANTMNLSQKKNVVGS